MVWCEFRMEMVEYILCNLGMDWSRSSSKVVKIYVEPLVNVVVNFEVFVAYFLRCALLLDCFHLSSSSILISAANIDGIISTHSAITSECIRTQHAPDYITQMWHIINVWQGTCYENVATTVLGKYFRSKIGSNTFLWFKQGFILWSYGRVLHFLFGLFGLLLYLWFWCWFFFYCTFFFSLWLFFFSLFPRLPLFTRFVLWWILLRKINFKIYLFCTSLIAWTIGSNAVPVYFIHVWTLACYFTSYYAYFTLIYAIISASVMVGPSMNPFSTSLFKCLRLSFLITFFFYGVPYFHNLKKK